MPARLILNADDFGLTPGINRAIVELYQAGVLTSTTLMANGPAFDDAVRLAIANPGLGVGCHIVLVDGEPVAPPEKIPSLLGSGGRSFRATLFDFARALQRGMVDGVEIAREARAQIQKLQRAGMDVTHVDTHKHTHCFPEVARQLAALLAKTSIEAIRNPFEPSFAKRLGHAGLLRRAQMALLGRYQSTFQAVTHNLVFPDGTLGISSTGNLTAETLHELLARLPENGTWELCCHPGYNDADLMQVQTRLRGQREIERETLLWEVPKMLSRPNAPQLIHYGMLGASGYLRDTGMWYPSTGYEEL